MGYRDHNMNMYFMYIDKAISGPVTFNYKCCTVQLYKQKFDFYKTYKPTAIAIASLKLIMNSKM